MATHQAARGALLFTVALAACQRECPLPIEEFCGSQCDDTQHWIDECNDSLNDDESCWVSSCGDYQVLTQQGKYSGETWYLDADGSLVAYKYSWEGDGPGLCGGSEYGGYDQYGEIPAGC
jgi:hypothetical protein